MKRLIIVLIVLMVVSGCGNEVTDTTDATETPKTEKDPYGLYEELLLKEEFADENYQICVYPETVYGYSVDYIPVAAYEDKTFMIDTFYLSLMQQGYNDISPQMMIDGYDYSWLTNTKTANGKTSNSDDSLIDPYAIINHLEADTILYQEVEIHKFSDDGERIDIDGDPNIKKEAIYRTDEEKPFSVGIYYKDSYIDEILKGELMMYGPKLTDGNSGPHFNFGRWYKVFISDGSTLSIKLDSYLDGTLITFELEDKSGKEPLVYRVEMMSDVDIKDVAGFSDAYNDFTFNFRPRLANDSSLEKGTVVSEADLLEPENYVHEEVLFKDEYDGAYVYGRADVEVSTYEEATFMLDDLIFGYDFKYFYYTWPHNKYLTDDMYVKDYDRSWIDRFVEENAAKGWDMTKVEGEVDPQKAINHFDDETLLFTDGLLVYDLVDGDKIIRETKYTSDKYGYEGNVTVGIRYEDSYLKKLFAGDVKKADITMEDAYKIMAEAKILRMYRSATSETNCLSFTIFDGEDRSLIIFDSGDEQFVFESDVELGDLL